MNSDGIADGSRSFQNTSVRGASTDASTSRAAMSADRIPCTAANTSAGNVTKATMNRIVGVPGPSQLTTDVMYATHGVTMTSTSSGCVAHSSGRLAASRAPTRIASTSAMPTPTSVCHAVSHVCSSQKDGLSRISSAIFEGAMVMNGLTSATRTHSSHSTIAVTMPSSAHTPGRWLTRRDGVSSPGALVQEVPQARLGGEELGVVLEVGRARVRQVDALDADHAGPGRADSTTTRSDR